ncbi:hypothetical protein NADFUDRAFT_82813 [Nadsonia fulvescens var. elongata DSM 6958]|uniref:C2H2-type domain-containing protein n=1 Tax=Nadsonia fulvescens var. elongata DSM 6958 TaxID=857566 RepID=A0A1E3PKP6_9ASCO|nr:hypothetical protein NADFUDRAFT_82813 [Nadsonia fulvescens var. elongata DSM 6958]
MLNSLVSSDSARTSAAVDTSTQLGAPYLTAVLAPNIDSSSPGLITFNVAPDSHGSKEKPVRKYHCLYCNQSFTRSEHKTRHERSHTKEKPFKCTKCSAKFVRKDLLLRHDRTVHGNNPKKKRGVKPFNTDQDTATPPNGEVGEQSCVSMKLETCAMLAEPSPSLDSFKDESFLSAANNTFLRKASAPTLLKWNTVYSAPALKLDSAITKSIASPSSLAALLNVAARLENKCANSPPSLLHSPSTQMISHIPRTHVDQSSIFPNTHTDSSRSLYLCSGSPNQKQSSHSGLTLDRTYSQTNNLIESQDYRDQQFKQFSPIPPPNLQQNTLQQNYTFETQIKCQQSPIQVQENSLQDSLIRNSSSSHQLNQPPSSCSTQPLLQKLKAQSSQASPSTKIEVGSVHDISKILGCGSPFFVSTSCSAVSKMKNPDPISSITNSTETDYNVALYMTELQYSSKQNKTENSIEVIKVNSANTTTSDPVSGISSTTMGTKLNELELPRLGIVGSTSGLGFGDQQKLTLTTKLDYKSPSTSDGDFLKNILSIISINLPSDDSKISNYPDLPHALPVIDYVPQICLHESIIYNQLVWLNIDVSSFTSFSSVLSPSLPSSVMPSQARINHSLMVFFKLFHSSYPFLHPQTLDLNNSPILLLSIFLLGEKIYQKEMIKSAMTSKKIITEIYQNSMFCKNLHNSLKAGLFRIINLLEKPQQSHNEIPIWVLQSLILSIFFESDLGHQDIETNYIVENEFSHSMSHYLTELVISKLETKQKEGNNGLIRDDELIHHWKSWIESELIKRLFFTLFVIFTKNDPSPSSSFLFSTSSLLLSQLYDRSDIEVRFPYSSLNWNKFFFNKHQFKLAILNQEYTKRKEFYAETSETDLISFLFEDNKYENQDKVRSYSAFLSRLIGNDERFNLNIISKIILSKIGKLKVRDQYIKKFLQKEYSTKEPLSTGIVGHDICGSYLIPLMKLYHIIRNQTRFENHEIRSDQTHQRISHGNSNHFKIIINADQTALNNILSEELKVIIGSANLFFPRALLFQQYLRIVAFKINVSQSFSPYFNILKESFKLIQIQETGKFLTINKASIISSFKLNIKDIIVKSDTSLVDQTESLLTDIVKNCFDLFWLEFHINKYFDNDSNKTFKSIADFLASDQLSNYDSSGDDLIIWHIMGKNDILFKFQRILILSIWMNLIESSINGSSASSVASANKMHFSTSHSVSILNDDSDNTIFPPGFISSESRMIYERIKQLLASISYTATSTNTPLQSQTCSSFVLLNNSNRSTNFSASILYYYSNFLTREQIDRRNNGTFEYYTDINDNMEKGRLCAVLGDLLGTLSKEIIY